MSCITIICFVTFYLVQISRGETEFSNYDLNQVVPIEMVSVGRVAKLGELYDARSDKFLHLSIFQSQLPANVVVSTQNYDAHLKYSYENTMEEKFKTLDISAGLKLSVLGGLFQLEGSGKFFKDTKTSAKSAKASLINSISTEYEQISITQNDIKKIIDLDSLQKIDATHVVVGIQWGGNVFVSVEDMNVDNIDQQTVQGSLKAKLTMLATQISGQAQVNVDEKEKQALSKFNFEIFGDILPDQMPNNLIDAVKFMKNATSSLHKANNGKGKAMKFSLIPIAVLRSMMKVQVQLNSLSNDVDEATVKSCVKLFDDINRVEQRLNDFVDDLVKFEKHILTSKVDQVKKIQFNYAVYQAEIHGNLSSHLIKVRSGNETVDKLQNVIIEANEHEYSWRNIEMKDFSELKGELSFLETMSKIGVTLLSKEQPLQDFLLKNYDNDTYILFYHDEYSNIEKPMETFMSMIKHKTKYGPTAIFASVKNEIFNISTETKISYYRNMKKVIDKFEINSVKPDMSKPELWSIYFMQTQLANLMANQVPRGFIYVQLAQQSEPRALWPNLKWTDITSSYSGLFFRAEGGNSARFGNVQAENIPHIKEIASHYRFDMSTKNGFSIDLDSLHDNQLSNLVWVSWLPAMGTASGNSYLKVLFHQGEVRPRNSAIRIWRRD